MNANCQHCGVLIGDVGIDGPESPIHSHYTCPYCGERLLPHFSGGMDA